MVTSMARVVERAAEGDLRRRAMSAGRRRGYWGRRFVGSMRVSNLLWMMPAMGPTVARMVWRVLRMALCRGVLLYLQEKRWSPKWSQSLRQWRQVGGGRQTGKTGRRCFRWKRRVYMSLERRPSECRREMECRARLVVVERSEGSAGWK